jgi:hypothetical protein
MEGGHGLRLVMVVQRIAARFHVEHGLRAVTSGCAQLRARLDYGDPRPCFTWNIRAHGNGDDRAIGDRRPPPVKSTPNVGCNRKRWQGVAYIAGCAPEPIPSAPYPRLSASLGTGKPTASRCTETRRHQFHLHPPMFHVKPPARDGVEHRDSVPRETCPEESCREAATRKGLAGRFPVQYTKYRPTSLYLR